MIYSYSHPEYFADMPEADYQCESGNLILFGAGVNGAIAYGILKKRGIEVLGFADNDIRKQGGNYLGHSVWSMQQAYALYPNATVLVTPYTLGKLMDNLHACGFGSVYDCAKLFLEFDMDDVRPYVAAVYDIFHCVQTFLDKRSGMGGALTVVITQRCSLRCKECMAFVPYYKNPADIPTEELFRAFDHVLPTGVFPNVYVEGGEPLLHKDFPQILQKLASYPEVERIWVITNGTLLPDAETIRAMASQEVVHKLIVWISDYGKLSHHMGDFKRILTAEGIDHHSTTQHWYQVTRAVEYERSIEETQTVYEDCCKGKVALNPFLIHGRVYRCQFHARSEELGVIPTTPLDSVDVFTDVDSLRKHLHDFVFRDSYIDACRYCCGRGYASMEVPVAEQAVGEMPPLVPVRALEEHVYTAESLGRSRI